MDELLNQQEYTDDMIRGIIQQSWNVNTMTDEIKDVLNTRLEAFMNEVVTPLRSMKVFDANKTHWYWAVYKEGIEAKKAQKTTFSKDYMPESLINKIVKDHEKKTVTELIELGTGYLSSLFSTITGFHRDNLIIQRLNVLYYSANPVDWILASEKENGVMETNVMSHPETSQLLSNISMIMKHRV